MSPSLVGGLDSKKSMIQYSKGLILDHSIIQIQMHGLRRRATVSNQTPAQECKQNFTNQSSELGGDHIIDQQQQQLVSNYTNALKRDFLKEEAIKLQLNYQFFNLNKNKKKKYYLQQKLNLAQNQNFQVRKKLSMEFKRSITGSKKTGSRIVHTSIPSTRYSPSLTTTTDCINRRFSYSPPLEGGANAYSSIIEGIIDEAHKVNTKPLRFQRSLMTATERKKFVELTDHKQKEEIIDKIIENEVDDYLKQQSIRAHHVNPEERKKYYEQIKMRQLTNLDRYNMSFISYMKQKTYNNIEKSIYNEKIRHKQTYVEKFQKFVLTQFKFSEQAKRRLQKVFKSIELQYKRSTKNKQISERIPK